MSDILNILQSDSPVYITAPMINQSDLPFRILTRRYGATITYTQMLKPKDLIYNQEYLEFYLRNMDSEACAGLGSPVVAQVCGNDVQEIVEGAKKLVGHCDAIDLNLGCPLDSARDEHFGSYLLGPPDWPVVENIVSALAHTLPIPVSTKIRLVNPIAQTLPFAQRMANAGSSWIALHARFGQAPRKRRNGPADLEQVKILKSALGIPVISNGNVRCYEDVVKNLDYTGANGIMVGEALLENPCLFADIIPDPVSISLEYLDVCRECSSGTVPIDIVQRHVKHIFNLQCSRRTWIPKFHRSLTACKTLDEIERLLRIKTQRWRGKPIIQEQDDESALETGSDDEESSRHSDVSLDGLYS